jgi:hypothetical protein
MEVTCRSCRASVASTAIDTERLLAQCDACGCLFDCSDQLSGPDPALARNRLRAPVPLPEGMQVTTSGDDEGLLGSNYRSESASVTGTLKLDHRWRASARFIWLQALYVVAYFALVAVWHEFVRAAIAGELELFYLAPPLIHIGTAAWLGYRVLAHIVNTTTITADAQTLTIHHGPLPVRKGKQVLVAAIDQLYCKQVKHTTSGKNGTKTYYSYAVFARLTDERELLLVEKLPNPEQALFIEQQLEAHLHIIDVPVDGEL